jgi:predicted nucleic acid-binding protein
LDAREKDSAIPARTDIEDGQLRLLRERARIRPELIAQVSPTGNLIPDTLLAALAIDHGCSVASTDGDFGRFPGLRWENPLSV